MALEAIMSSQERAAAQAAVDNANRMLAQELGQRTVSPNQSMGKDDFLRILITQLRHQDPTAPMQDTEFIAQMAQFSSLEQMSNMAADFARMAQMLQQSDAASVLGKGVELNLGDDQVIQGVVQAVTRDEMPQILVNGVYFNWDMVTRIFDPRD
ncbi:MAG: flagellar hook assembly protein FlgD [Treponema sp.]|nr:flagellar hook assembly protein FlgD [Treponema sp.]